MQRFRASGHLFPFFRRIQKKTRESSFCAFPIRVYYKANSSLSKGRFSRTRTRPRPLLSSQKRIARIRSALKKEKLRKEEKLAPARERVERTKSFHFCPSLLSQRGTKKKKREISREKTPKGGKALALLKRKIWTKKDTKNTD